MRIPRLAVCLNDLSTDVKAAMVLARRLEFGAVDVSAVQGPVSPRELSGSGQRHLLRYLADLALRLGSLRGPVGGAGYADSAAGEQRLDTMREIIHLAAALRVPVVSTAPGALPGGKATREAGRLREAFALLADEADRSGVMVAVETSGLGAPDVKKLITEIRSPSLAACCDTGAILMQGGDPSSMSELLAGDVRLVRARDAVRGSVEAPGHEVAMGEGQLDAARLLAALEQGEFNGDIVLTRTSGANRAEDLRRAREMLDKHLR
jgi:sugar phosphate isomerase/epimerase